MVRGALLAFLLVATGCTRKVADVGGNLGDASVDAGHPPMSRATRSFFSEAGVLTAQRQILRDGSIWAFTESSGRLFWVRSEGSGSPAPNGSPDQYILRSCSPFACAGSLQSFQLVPTAGGPPSWLWASDSRLFWPDETGVSFCNRDDCSSTGHLPFNPTGMDFVADEKQAFFGGAAACDIDDCSSTYRNLAPALPNGEPSLEASRATVLDEDFLYQITGQRIVRFRKDGTGEVQILARDRVDAFHIAVRNGYAYWTESVSPGGLLRCPVAGCSGAPEVVASNLEHPEDLTVDDSYVYFEEPEQLNSQNEVLQFSTKRISRCAVTGCMTPERLIENQGIVSAPFVDGRFVYFSGGDCLGNCASYVGAVPK
jgi:hypothetical protein